jgi:hypothetical protein
MHASDKPCSPHIQFVPINLHRTNQKPSTTRSPPAFSNSPCKHELSMENFCQSRCCPKNRHFSPWTWINHLDSCKWICSEMAGCLAPGLKGVLCDDVYLARYCKRAVSSACGAPRDVIVCQVVSTELKEPGRFIRCAFRSRSYSGA